MGWNDSRGVNLSSDGTTQGESFCPGMERFQGSHSIQRTEGLQGSNSVLRWNNSLDVILSWDRTTPRESFCPGIDRLQGSPSDLGWKDSREPFCPGLERFQGSHSVLGWNDSRGIIPF